IKEAPDSVSERPRNVGVVAVRVKSSLGLAEALYYRVHAQVYFARGCRAGGRAIALTAGLGRRARARATIVRQSLTTGTTGTLRRHTRLRSSESASLPPVLARLGCPPGGKSRCLPAPPCSKPRLWRWPVGHCPAV